MEPPPSARTRRLSRIVALRRHWRTFLALMVGFLIFIQILAFSPTRLEKDIPPPALTEQTILDQVVEIAHKGEPAEKEPAIPKLTIPEGKVPDYSVDGFQFVSTQAGVKQWRIEADHAFFYQKLGFVHAKGVKASIYDRSGSVTKVTSGEAKYDVNTRDLELFTNVNTEFTMGLRTNSPYLKYDAKGRVLLVPPQVPITGVSPGDDENEEMGFFSYGLIVKQDQQVAELLDRVRVEARRVTAKGEREVTVLESDTATIDKAKGRAKFHMRDGPKGKVAFVRITQPGLNCRARRAEFNFGEREKQLRTVRAFEEVRIEELPKKDPNYASDPRVKKPTARYATAGFAEFDSQRNVIVLRDFPQVYQDHDTITGEVILVHRGSDLVEVEQSNAFTQGSESGKNGSSAGSR